MNKLANVEGESAGKLNEAKVSNKMKLLNKRKAEVIYNLSSGLKTEDNIEKP